MECVRQDEGDGGKFGVRCARTGRGAAANCGMQCVGQDHVAGGKKAVCTSCENKSQQTKSLWRFPLIIS